MEQPELDLREILYIIRRRLWILIVLPLTAALAAGVISVFVLDPVYSASTTLWVIKDDPAQLNLNDVMLSRNLTKTYAEVAKSRAVLTPVADRFKGSNVTVKGLQDSLTVTPVRDTEIISFTVEEKDPALAAQLADAVAKSFQEQIRSYMKVENVVVVDEAQQPTSPIKPRKTMNVAIAMVLGFMAAAGLAFLLEYLDTSVKTPEDVARYIDLPVLGVIPEISLEPEVRARKPSRSRKRREVRA